MPCSEKEAVINDDECAAKMFVDDEQFDVNARDSSSKTALKMAADLGRERIVEILISRQVKSNAQKVVK